MKNINKNLKKMSEEDLQWVYSHVTGKKTRDSKKDIIQKLIKPLKKRNYKFAEILEKDVCKNIPKDWNEYAKLKTKCDKKIETKCEEIKLDHDHKRPAEMLRIAKYQENLKKIKENFY